MPLITLYVYGFASASFGADARTMKHFIVSPQQIMNLCKHCIILKSSMLCFVENVLCMYHQRWLDYILKKTTKILVESQFYHVHPQKNPQLAKQTFYYKHYISFNNFLRLQAL